MFFFFYMRESKASRLRQAASGWPIRLFHFRFFSIVIVVDNCTEGTCQKSREQKWWFALELVVSDQQPPLRNFWWKWNLICCIDLGYCLTIFRLYENRHPEMYMGNILMYMGKKLNCFPYGMDNNIARWLEAFCLYYVWYWRVQANEIVDFLDRKYLRVTGSCDGKHIKMNRYNSHMRKGNFATESLLVYFQYYGAQRFPNIFCLI